MREKRSLDTCQFRKCYLFLYLVRCWQQVDARGGGVELSSLVCAVKTLRPGVTLSRPSCLSPRGSSYLILPPRDARTRRQIARIEERVALAVHTRRRARNLGQTPPPRAPPPLDYMWYRVFGIREFRLPFRYCFGPVFYFSVSFTKLGRQPVERRSTPCSFSAVFKKFLNLVDSFLLTTTRGSFTVGSMSLKKTMSLNYRRVTPFPYNSDYTANF